jgi:hypothetical protein
MDFDDPDATLVCVCKVAEDRGDLSTGRAMIAPEVYENWKRGLEDLRLKGLVRDVSEFCHPIPPLSPKLRLGR